MIINFFFIIDFNNFQIIFLIILKSYLHFSFHFLLNLQKLVFFHFHISNLNINYLILFITMFYYSNLIHFISIISLKCQFFIHIFYILINKFNFLNFICHIDFIISIFILFLQFFISN